MEATKPTPEEIEFCMQNPKCVRNVSILAHVDHGKTTITDNILATNRILSKRLAGQVRLLDDREDEQQRGITMKSSAVSIMNMVQDPYEGRQRPILLNMVDTPGHIDFSTEVGAALRICDGAIIVVDLLEGVCAQTRECIKNAFDEHTKMILLLNKIDRLFIEKRMSDLDIFDQIRSVIENCNALIAELYQYSWAKNLDNKQKLQVEEVPGLLFNPEIGNVIFASAIDGWGFSLQQVAEKLVHSVRQETVESLNRKLWDFDSYVSRSKEIRSGAIEGRLPNVFTTLCIKTLRFVYINLVVRMDRSQTEVILHKLNLTNRATTDMRHVNVKIQVKAILEAWMPLANCIFVQCLHCLPSPVTMDKEKVDYLTHKNHYIGDPYLTTVCNKMGEKMINIEPRLELPVIAYISKMFWTHEKYINEDLKLKTEQLESESEEDICGEATNQVKQEIKLETKHELNEIKAEPEEVKDEIMMEVKEETCTEPELPRQIRMEYGQTGTLLIDGMMDGENTQFDDETEGMQDQDNNIMLSENSTRIIGLTRVFHGVLKRRDYVYVLNSTYLPTKSSLHSYPTEFETQNVGVKRIRLENLYMLYGKEWRLVDRVPAGNICGIGGIHQNVLRTATITNTLKSLPLIEKYLLEPVVHHSIEPLNPRDLPVLRAGLRLLMQNDSCVQVMITRLGEMILYTAGDVHLEKCIKDLQTLTDIQFRVGEPAVPLRETIILSNHQQYGYKMEINDSRAITIENAFMKMTVYAVPMSFVLYCTILCNFNHLSSMEKIQQRAVADRIRLQIQGLPYPGPSEAELTIMQRLRDLFYEMYDNSQLSDEEDWAVKHTIWSVGKKNNPFNILLNQSQENRDFHILSDIDIELEPRYIFYHNIVNAFNDVVKCGPLCGEPIDKTAFVIRRFELIKDVIPGEITPQFIASVESSIRGAFFRAFEAQHMRLVEPVFTTGIEVNTKILGKVYSVVNKRQGKVVEAVGMDEDEKKYLVKAQIPVLESAGFANEIRKTTSGQANPTLKFSHYEVIDGDPFFELVEDDDEIDESVNVEASLRAAKLRKDVRRRKGLHVDDEVVVHAEKQRTLNKKK